MPNDAQLWLKRLRKAFEPAPLRFFLVGEYGEKHWRPHYHAAVFGVGPEDSERIAGTWPQGFTYTGDLSEASAEYIAGYVTKKFSVQRDAEMEDRGLRPEFARMSLRPGIGAFAVNKIFAALRAAPVRLQDAPATVRHGGKEWPLGRYLRGRLRREMGVSEDGKAPTCARNEYQAKMLELLGTAYLEPKFASFSVSRIFAALSEQSALNQLARLKLKESKAQRRVRL